MGWRDARVPPLSVGVGAFALVVSHPQSASTLGEAICNAALAARGILDQVDERRL